MTFTTRGQDPAVPYEQILNDWIERDIAPLTTTRRFLRSIKRYEQVTADHQAIVLNVLRTLFAAVIDGSLKRGLHYGVNREDRIGFSLEPTLAFLRDAGRASWTVLWTKFWLRRTRRFWPGLVIGTRRMYLTSERPYVILIDIAKAEAITGCQLPRVSKRVSPES